MIDPAPLMSPREAAQYLLRKHWDGMLPVRPERIAASLGVSVRVRGEGEDAAYMHSGGLVVRACTHWIEFNTKEPLVRQRFSLAHSLGHRILCHLETPLDSTSSFMQNHPDPMERAANAFAMELLMPATAVQSAVRTGRADSLDSMADLFCVSRVAAGHRMNNLLDAVPLS